MRWPSPTRRTTSGRPSRSRGPLHGIPVLVKDNIDTADKMATTAGSLAIGWCEAARGFVYRQAAAVQGGGRVAGQNEFK